MGVRGLTLRFTTQQGEISLRGRITAVGGIKEKLIGALRAGVKTVLLPAQNRKDVKDLPQEVKDGLEIVYVRYVWDTLFSSLFEALTPIIPTPTGSRTGLLLTW